MASVTAASSPLFDRTVLGPLTTTFIPPEECTIFGVYNSNENTNGVDLFCLEQGCYSSTVVDTTTCWPEIAPSVTVPGHTENGFGFYSPGLICPSGYTTACGSAVLSNGLPSPLIGLSTFTFQYPLIDGETAIGCCPTGMSCALASGVQECQAFVTSTDIKIGLCGSTAYDSVYELNIPGPVTYKDISGTVQTANATGTQVVWAPLFQLNWRSEDLVPTTSSTTLQTNTTQSIPSSTPTATSSSSSSTTPTPPPPDQNTGLSSGAKIGIGVGVPLGVLAIAFLVICLLLRKRRQRQRPMSMPSQQQQQPQGEEKYGGDGNTFYSPGLGTEVEGSSPRPDSEQPVNSNPSGPHEIWGGTVYADGSSHHPP